MAGIPGLEARLRKHVEALAEPRHWESSPEGLARAEAYVTDQLDGLGFIITREPFRYRGQLFHNVVARPPGPGTGRPRQLLGAHLDTVHGSPGANDNGSGLAGLIEVARSTMEAPVDGPIDFVAFHLEERQGWTYRVGSRHFAAKARRTGVPYEAAFVFDMIGYRRTEADSQHIPRILTPLRLPTTGDFIAVLGDGRSKAVVKGFSAAASDTCPDLPVVTLTVPLRGWPVWHTRRSDNASFWSARIPSVLITDTGNFRNPHYHRPSDRPGTLDYGFMADVVRATGCAVRRRAGSEDREYRR